MSLLSFRKMSVVENLKLTLERISQAYAQAQPNVRSSHMPTLVAISKTKPKEDIIECYRAGQRIFGENYVQVNLPSEQSYIYVLINLFFSGIS